MGKHLSRAFLGHQNQLQESLSVLCTESAFQASFYEPHTISCPLPLTSTNGMEKTQHAPSVHPLQTSRTFWLAAKQVCHRAGTSAGITKSFSAWQLLWRPGRQRSMPCVLHHHILHLLEHSSERGNPAIVPSTSDIGQLEGAQNWKLVADLNQRLCFPSEIATTNLTQDLVL